MKETVIFHVLDSQRHSKLFSYASSRSQKTQLEELSGHYLVDSLGPFPPIVPLEGHQWMMNEADRIMESILLDCQMSGMG